MKKQLLVSGSVVALVVTGILGFNAMAGRANSPHAKQDTLSAFPAQQEKVLLPEHLRPGPEYSDFHALYGDRASSLDEMAKQSSLIVVAKVIDQSAASTVATANRLQVMRTIAGKTFEEITVYQIGQPGEEDLLTVGDTYFLFLGKQTDGKEDTFYIKGGHQGQFSASQGKLIGPPEFLGSVAVKAGQDPFQALETRVRPALR